MTRPDFSYVRSPLVGRDVEFDRVQAALDRATAGGGRLVLVSGEPGIGKTRFVDELAAVAADQGALVARGRVDDLVGAPPYWPWVQALGDLIDQAGAGGLGAALAVNAGPLRAILPQVADLAGPLPAPPVLDPAAGRFRLHDAVAGLVIGAAANRPLVVVLDDMHWADVSSLELTRFLAPRIRGCPILLAIVYRDIDHGDSEPFADVLASLAREPTLERVALTGLSPAEVGRLMTQATGLRPRPARVAALHARTEGNPFFVTELVRLLQSEGATATAAASQPGRVVEEPAVPIGVRDVVRRRLARLPDGTGDVLLLAAVLGREFDLAVLGVSADLGVSEVVDLLEPALTAGLVCEVGGRLGRLRFSHALVRDAVYGELTGPRRAQRHARVGEALERADGPAGRRLAELSWHFFHAAAVLGPDRGIDYALEAAAAAQVAVSHERAEHELLRAQRLVELLPPGLGRWEKELEIQNRLVALLILNRGFAAPEVGLASARARHLCEQIGATDRLFKALNNLANFHHVRGDLRVATDLAGQLLAIGEQRSDVTWLTAGHLFLGMAHLQAGRLRAAEQTFAELRELAAKLEASTQVADSFFGLHPMALALLYSSRSAAYLGDDARAQAYAEQGIHLAAGLGHPHTLAFAWYFESCVQILLGNVRRVLDRSTTAIAFCSEHGLTAYRCWFRVLRGWAIGALGRPEEGFREMVEEIAVNEASGAGTNRPFFLSLQADAEAWRGNRRRALDLVEEAIAGLGEARLWESVLHRQRGELLAAEGPERRVAAVSSLRLAVSVAEAQGAVPFAKRAAAALAALGPVEHAAVGHGPTTTAPALSLRERELLRLVGRGRTDKEIAGELVISVATVRSHLDRIRDKTGRRRRPELTRLAGELGLADD